MQFRQVVRDAPVARAYVGANKSTKCGWHRASACFSAPGYVLPAGDGQDALSDTAGQNIIRFVSPKGSAAIDLGQVQAANVLGASGSHDLVLTYSASDTITIEGLFDMRRGPARVIRATLLRPSARTPQRVA